MIPTENHSGTIATSDWNSQFADLKRRFPKVKDSVIFAIHALQLNPDIELGDLKAQAQIHGIRVTAASMTAARRHMDPRSDSDGDSGVSGPDVPKRKSARPRGRRAAPVPLDVDALIRSTVAKIQGQGAAEADRLCEAMRKAVAVLQAAIESCDPKVATGGER